jgi:hypothetical protein
METNKGKDDASKEQDSNGPHEIKHACGSSALRFPQGMKKRGIPSMRDIQILASKSWKTKYKSQRARSTSEVVNA